MHLRDVVAIITGAARGFGKAFSEAVLKGGGKVCFADVNATEGEATEKSFQEIYGSDAVLFVKCDVTKDNEFKGLITFIPLQTKDLVSQAKTKFDHINVFVNNAGILNESMWERTVEINLMGTIRGTLLAVEIMRKDHGGKGGVVINIASISGINPGFFLPAYAASKFGVVGLTRSWAENPRNEEMGLSFACICPQMCETALTGQLLHDDNPPVLFWNESYDALQIRLDKIGIMSVDRVVDTFVELLRKGTCNGDVVTVTRTGNEYLYTGKSSRI